MQRIPTRACVIAFLLLGLAADARDEVLSPAVTLHVDRNSDIARTISTLSGRDRDNASRIGAYPIATWFTGGTPAELRGKVSALAVEAASANAIPVLVAYNLPFRDCQQYSAGGAANAEDYKAWVRALAAGIAQHRMVVLLEPDGLGIVPHFTNLKGEKEWCRPKGLDIRAATERFELLNFAVDTLAALPHTAIYLDGTHSGWLEVGDISHRLVRAGVLRANGFFLNVSNYEPTARLEKYGTWIAKCIYFATYAKPQSARFEECASQFAPARIDDFESWRLTDAWYANHVDVPLQPNPSALPHFVIDTSRNGQGQWTPPQGRFRDPQRWCNPPGRGLGERPTTRVGHPLMDAKLWIKVPGESDGQCTRGANGRIDPVRRMVDPPAGKWFKEQAAELIRFAMPQL